MYQDLSFMNVPLPEDVLKLKIYGDYVNWFKSQGQKVDSPC